MVINHHGWKYLYLKKIIRELVFEFQTYVENVHLRNANASTLQ